MSYQPNFDAEREETYTYKIECGRHEWNVIFRALNQLRNGVTIDETAASIATRILDVMKDADL